MISQTGNYNIENQKHNDEDFDVFFVKKYIKCVVIMLICIIWNLSFLNLFGQSNYGVPKDSSWQRLTVRQKIGQLVIANFSDSVFLTPNINEYLSKYPIGNFFLSHTPVDRREQRLKQIKLLSLYPVMFVGDNEAGAGNNFDDLTQFTNLMGLSATKSKNLTFDYAKATAFETKSIGINWIFSPVVDINLNPFNPIINVRSFGDDKNQIISLSTSYIEGLQQNGIAACAKHFPGDGVDFRDQHLITSCNSLTRHEWFSQYGAVFRNAIDQGVYTIMAGHISLPFYQRQKLEGFYPPATLSSEILKGLLRKELHFKGVIVSDALVMGGFIKWYDNDQERDVACFKAGCDMLLWPNIPAFFDAMTRKIESKEISIEDLNESVKRVWWLKEKLGLINSVDQTQRNLSGTDKEFIARTNKNVAEESITLRQDLSNRLPLKVDELKKVLIVTISPQNGDLFNTLRKAFQSKGFQVDTIKNNYKKKYNANDYDLIVYAVSRLTHKPVGNLNFQGAEAADGIWHSLSESRNKSVVISFGSPYFFKEYFERASIYIDAYSTASSVQQAVVNALFGDIKFKGKVPVRDRKSIFVTKDLGEF